MNLINKSNDRKCNSCCNQEKPKQVIELCESWCKENHECKTKCDHEINIEGNK